MRFDAVIFDIDNVLVDTRASYTDCIRRTVETYLETILNFQPARTPLLTRLDVEQFKSLGGFNDDWDTCYGLLLYLLSLKTRKRTINELRKQKEQLQPHDVGAIHESPLHLQGVRRAEHWFGKNNAVSLGKIADIFQRFYLSEFVWNEKPLIPKSLLKKLKGSGLKIGIVTGRNHEEAEFALRRFRMDGMIDATITADDTPKHLKKPNPHGLLKVASKLGKSLRYLYVGDLPDDILAARRAKKKIRIGSCGFLQASSIPHEMKQEMKKAKADFICAQAKELMRIILPTRRSS